MFSKRTTRIGVGEQSPANSWPDVSETLAEVDDDAFVRAIVDGRRRELASH